MPSYDMTARFGLDDRDYARGLKRTVQYAERAGLDIERTFGKHGAAIEKRFGGSVKGTTKELRLMKTAGRAVFADAVISSGLRFLSAGLQAAAERSADVRHELELTRRAGRNAMADIGEGVSSLVGGADTLIDRIARIRAGAENGLANAFNFLTGSPTDAFEVSRVQAADRAGQAAFAQDRAFNDMRRGQAAAAGGRAGAEAQILRDQAAAVRAIAEAVNSGRISTVQGQELREGVAGESARRRAELDARDAEARRAARERDLRGVVESSPEGSARRVHAERSLLELQRDREIAGIDRTLSPEARARLAESITADFARRDAARRRSGIDAEHARNTDRREAGAELERRLAGLETRALGEQARALRERAAGADSQTSTELTRRAAALEREAETRRVIAEHAERVRDVESDTRLTAEQRAGALARLTSLRDGALARVEAGEPGDRRSRVSTTTVADAGASAAARRQIFGVGAGTAAAAGGPESQTAKNTATANGLLREIRDGVRQGGLALAAP